jgi:hypothetical protein
MAWSDAAGQASIDSAPPLDSVSMVDGAAEVVRRSSDWRELSAQART